MVPIEITYMAAVTLQLIQIKLYFIVNEFRHGINKYYIQQILSTVLIPRFRLCFTQKRKHHP